MYGRAEQTTDGSYAFNSTNTHSDYVIFIIFSAATLHERPSILRYTRKYIAGLAEDLNDLTIFIIASVGATVSIVFTPNTFL